MIISHKHKFIFIKSRKTAGTSLEIALSQYCGPEDVITTISKEDSIIRKELGFRRHQNFLIPFKKYTLKQYVKFLLKGKKAFFYNHIPAKSIKRIVGKEIWNSYYKFCFERNPFDKIVSLYHWRNRKVEKPLTISKWILKNQHLLYNELNIYTINDDVAVDKVYKYENMDEALMDISSKLNFTSPLNLPTQKSKSSFRDPSLNCTKELNKSDIDIIRKIFRKELVLFGY